MGEENEPFYDNLILESIINNQEIPLCRIEDTPETPLTGSTPYLPSETIANTSENVLAVSVDDSHTKLENYIDEKYGQVSIKYLKEKKINEVKQQFSPNNQGDKINAELVKSLREQIENLRSKICFYAKK